MRKKFMPVGHEILSSLPNDGIQFVIIGTAGSMVYKDLLTCVIDLVNLRAYTIDASSYLDFAGNFERLIFSFSLREFGNFDYSGRELGDPIAYSYLKDKSLSEIASTKINSPDGFIFVDLNERSAIRFSNYNQLLMEVTLVLCDSSDDDDIPYVSHGLNYALRRMSDVHFGGLATYVGTREYS